MQVSGETDIYVSKRNAAGTLLWEQTYAGSAGFDDYGTVVTLDDNDNVIVAGVVVLADETTDYVMLKYSATGVLTWSAVFDGGYNTFDFPIALLSTQTGIYAAGASLGNTFNSFEQTNWVITKRLHISGAESWTTTYDYLDNQDIPVSIDPLANGNISVKGFLSSNQGTWDFADIRFSGADGSWLSGINQPVPDLAISEAIAVTGDADNNIYIAGTTNDGNKDMQLVKFDADLNLAWTERVDAEGLEDRGLSVLVSPAGKVYLAGDSDKTNGGKQITLAEFDTAGGIISKRGYNAPVTYERAAMKTMRINDSGEVYVAGTVQRNGNDDFVTLMYDSTGVLRFEKFYGKSTNSEDRVTDMVLTDDGGVLVTGTSEGQGLSTYQTVKYEMLKRSDVVVENNGEPFRRSAEFIVKFKPEVVLPEFVDDKTQRYGDIFDILDFGVASRITQRLDLRQVNFSKVFPRLTTTHTQSITRLGDTIAMPEFWSTFLVVLETDEATNQLMTDFAGLTDFVVYAHYNHVYTKTQTPNDNFFQNGSQASLFPSTAFPNGHINVEPAWNIETGQSHTKVGVFDEVIFWAHEDFGDGTLEGSQIVGGWDFNGDGTSIAAVTNPDSHGTSCAGIIGALRDNNTIGIAGIAGGGPDADGNENGGVQLFSMGILDANDFAGTATAAAAITEGAMFVPDGNPTGYGLHIQNHSWTGNDSDLTMQRAIKFSFRNQCVVVAGRGNLGTDELKYPACYTDEWVISVGGSGTDGDRYDGTNGNSWEGNTVPGSAFGGGMDVVAPYVTELITSLINPNKPVTNFDNTYPAPQGIGNNYQSFSGTSAAAPHVSGVAALMHSLHHVDNGQENNLAPEDIEFLLQRYARDFPVFQDADGFGLINASEVIERLEAPVWKVFHSGLPNNTSSTTQQLNNVWLSLPFGINNLPAGNYVADKRVQVTNSYLNVFPSTTQIIDGWGRTSSTVGLSAANPNSGFEWADFDFTIQDNVASVTTNNFAWHIISNSSGQSLDEWIPAPPDQLSTAYSLHLFDPTATNNFNVEANNTIQVFPNPSESSFSIEFPAVVENSAFIEVSNSTGQTILKTHLNPGMTSAQINLSSHAAGYYVISVITKKGVESAKIVKL